MARDTAFDSRLACCAHARQQEPPSPATKGSAQMRNESNGQEKEATGISCPSPVWGGRRARTGLASAPALYLCPSARIGTFNQQHQER